MSRDSFHLQGKLIFWLQRRLSLVVFPILVCYIPTSMLYRVMDTPSWDGREAPRRLANADSLPPAVKVRLAHGPFRPMRMDAYDCSTTFQIHSCNTIWSIYVLHIGPGLTQPQRQPFGGLEVGKDSLATATPPRVSVVFFQNKNDRLKSKP